MVRLCQRFESAWELFLFFCLFRVRNKLFLFFLKRFDAGLFLGVIFISRLFEINMLQNSVSISEMDLEKIAAIVNHVYRETEKGLWKPGAARTNVEEIKQIADNGELAVARLNDEIVGCVRIQRLDERTGEFGMLAVDEQYQGNGIGRALIRFAEEKCKSENLQNMQLELLVPNEGSHPFKARLEKWYTRIGYVPVHTESVDALFPELAPMLAIPCKFIIFHKEL